MFRLPLYAPFAALVPLLAGCVDNTPYVPPAADSPQFATITGALIPIGSKLSPDAIAYVVAIDGRYTNGGWTSWDKPIRLPPGPHQIIFSQCYCSLWRHAGLGTVGVDAVFQPGTQYRLTASTPVRATLLSDATSQAWISDANGTPVSRNVTITLRAQPDGGAIPIFTPAH